MTSGVVILDEVRFLSFHSGYDFGYLIKLLTNQNLPAEEGKFFEVLYLYFPVIYDVKYLMKSCKNLKGGLQEVSEQLELERIGPQHQAGSDSLLTGATFFKMRELYFEGNIDNEKYCGHLYGLGTQHVQNGNDSGASQSPPVGVGGQGPALPPTSNNTATPTNTDSADGNAAGDGNAVDEAHDNSHK
jgi:CCR4-NOT transcription complex subunit 7/8